MTNMMGDRITSPRDEPSLDIEHLRRCTNGDEELEKELLGLFRVQARVQLELISIARNPSDYRLAVHTLKGAALVIGAKALAATAVELEKLGFAGESPERRHLISQMTSEVAVVEGVISRITG